MRVRSASLHELARASSTNSSSSLARPHATECVSSLPSDVCGQFSSCQFISISTPFHPCGVCRAMVAVVYAWRKRSQFRLLTRSTGFSLRSTDGHNLSAESCRRSSGSMIRTFERQAHGDSQLTTISLQKTRSPSLRSTKMSQWQKPFQAISLGNLPSPPPPHHGQGQGLNSDCSICCETRTLLEMLENGFPNQAPNSSLEPSQYIAP